MHLEYFQMIDRVVDLNVNDRTILVESTVPTESTIFEGHFPGYPLMPGVLLTETMAQTSGWLLLGLNKLTRMPFLAGVKDAKFRSFVQPGARLLVTARLEHEGSGYTVTRAAIGVDGKRVCDAQLTFRIVDFPTTNMFGYIHDTAARIDLPHLETAGA